MSNVSEPTTQTRVERAASTTTTPQPQTETTGNGEVKDPIIIGFLCEWAADLNHILDGEGVVRGLPNVRVIKIPCSGMTKPAWLEMAIKQGADGVFVCGCPIVDCHFREGNVFIRDRMYSRRTPKPKRLDVARMRGYWYEALETDKLMDDLRQFTADLKELNAAGK